MIDTRPTFQMIEGGGDIVEILEDTLERAKTGELEGVVICGITNTQRLGWTWAHKDGIEAPWPRLLAAVSSAQYELVSEGLNP